MTKEDLIAFERKIADLWEQGKIDAPVHLCGGNEDQLIEIFKEIKPHDFVFSGHRNHYHALLHGVKPDAILEAIVGNSTEVHATRGRSMGFIDHARHFYSSAIVGGMCAPAVGLAWALKRRQDNFKADPLNIDEFAQRPPERHVWCFVGDGALDGGHFWEALNYADGFKLPITFVVEDNNRATKTPIVDRCGFAVGLREIIKGHPNVKWYYYSTTWPHVGIGKYVQF